MSNNTCIDRGDNYVQTAVGRLTFPFLYSPKANQKGVDKYEASVVFDDDADLTVLTDIMVRLAKEKFGDNIPPKVKTKIKTLQGKNKKLEFDTGEKNYNLYQQDGELKGLRVLQCSDPDMPAMIDSNNKPIFGLDDEPNDRTQKIKKNLYAGCYVSIVANVYAGIHKETNNKYLSTYLKGVKFARDGEPLGAPRKDVKSMFGAAPAESTVSEDTSSDSSDGWGDEDDGEL